MGDVISQLVNGVSLKLLGMPVELIAAGMPPNQFGGQACLSISIADEHTILTLITASDPSESPQCAP